jgi:anti-sigma B factor antagonist
LSELSEALWLFITNNGPRSRLDVGGEIDLATIDALRDHLALLVEAGIGDVQVDMAAVTFCDATVLHVLLAARQTLDADGRHLHVVNPSPSTLRLLELADLDTTLLAPPPRQPQHRPSLPTRTCRTPHAAPGADGGRQEGTEHADRQARHRPLS